MLKAELGKSKGRRLLLTCSNVDAAQNNISFYTSPTKKKTSTSFFFLLMRDHESLRAVPCPLIRAPHIRAVRFRDLVPRPYRAMNIQRASILNYECRGTSSCPQPTTSLNQTKNLQVGVDVHHASQNKVHCALQLKSIAKAVLEPQERHMRPDGHGESSHGHALAA